MVKKLLFLTPGINISGEPMVTKDLALVLRKEKNLISVVLPRKGPMYSKFLDAGLSVDTNPDIFKKPSNYSEFFKKFDLIFLCNFQCFHISEPIKKIAIPLIWIVHGARRELLKKNKLSKFHFNLPEKIIFVSNTARKLFSDMEQKKNFLTIYPGIDIGNIEEFIQKK